MSSFVSSAQESTTADITNRAQLYGFEQWYLDLVSPGKLEYLK